MRKANLFKLYTPLHPISWMAFAFLACASFFPSFDALANPLPALQKNLPPVDYPAAVSTIIYGLDKVIEAAPLAIQSQVQLKDPSEVQGLASGRQQGPSGADELQIIQSQFNEGQDIGDIAQLMVQDFIDIIIDFYSGESEWGITGLCYEPYSNYYPYQEYYWPAMMGEITGEPLSGEYLEKDFIRETFKDAFDGGLYLPVLSENFETPSDAFDMADILAPYDVNRAKALTEPESNGEQKDALTRIQDRLAALGQQESIPDTPNQIAGFHGDVNAYERAESGIHFRNVESYRFSSLANLTNVPIAYAGNCHKKYIAESSFPFIHRSDNPLYFPFTRSPAHTDILMLLNAKFDKVMLSASPGTCVAYDLLSFKGMPGSLGVWPGEARFGLLAEVNKGIIGGGLALLGASEDNCLKSAGSLYPLTNRIRGNKYFQSHFYTRMLRADKLTNYLSFDGLPSFHRKSGSGSRYPSKIQVLRSSFGSHDPEELTPSLWKDPFTSPISYSLKRKGNKMDIGTFVEWHGMNCCPDDYTVLYGNTPEIEGKERYTGDGWD